MSPRVESLALTETSNSTLSASSCAVVALSSAIVAIAAAMSSVEHSLIRSISPCPKMILGPRGTDFPTAAAPTAGTSAVAATVAAASLDWIWGSDPSPAKLGPSSTDEAEVSMLMPRISSETPVEATGAPGVSTEISYDVDMLQLDFDSSSGRLRAVISGRLREPNVTVQRCFPEDSRVRQTQLIVVQVTAGT